MMLLNVLRAKIQGATVTAKSLHYEGSLTLDQDVMDAAGLLPWEKVLVVNLNTGDRIETYLIPGEKGSGTVCLNGGAARCGEVGDELIVMVFCSLEASEAASHRPVVVYLDEKNTVKKVRK